MFSLPGQSFPQWNGRPCIFEKREKKSHEVSFASRYWLLNKRINQFQTYSFIILPPKGASPSMMAESWIKSYSSYLTNLLKKSPQSMLGICKIKIPFLGLDPFPY